MSWDVIGHDWAITLLKRHIRDHRTRHAYLFVGPESVGKRTLARKFAQALSCERAPESGEFCGECRACQSIAADNYPDFAVLAPNPSIFIDDVRDMQRSLSLAPYEGPRKIALLVDFHRASTQAANAMLKTLEEPPERVVLLLTAPAQEHLLPTVVSRCEVITLRGVPTQTIGHALESHELETGRSDLLAALSEGRPGRALRWLGDAESFDRRSLALDQLIEAMQRDARDRFALAEQVTGRGELAARRRRVADTLEAWLSLCRDLLYRSNRAGIAARNPDRIAAFENAASKITPGESYQMVRSISETMVAVDGYADPRLALEALLLKLPNAS